MPEGNRPHFRKTRMQATCCSSPPNKKITAATPMLLLPRCMPKGSDTNSWTRLQLLLFLLVGEKTRKELFDCPSLLHCHVASHSFWCGRRRHIQQFSIARCNCRVHSASGTVATTKQWTCATCNQSQVAHDSLYKTVDPCNAENAMRWLLLAACLTTLIANNGQTQRIMHGGCEEGSSGMTGDNGQHFSLISATQ